jgi:sporulation protein YlmC with PRC-barrel domain
LNDTNKTVHGMTTDDVALDETNSLIASDKVEGTKVYSTTGEHIGSIYNLMIDKRSGQVAYAVMSFGGFLGLGERYHPLPWKKLTYDTRLDGYTVDIDPRMLETAPSFAPGENPWVTPGYGPGVYGFYGMSGYV